MDDETQAQNHYLTHCTMISFPQQILKAEVKQAHIDSGYVPCSISGLLYISSTVESLANDGKVSLIDHQLLRGSRLRES